MKSTITSVFFVLLSFSAFCANKVVYSENFENATVTETTLGNASAMNYGGGAVWTFGLETNYPITGNKSAYFNIANTGSDWWTLQYRIDSKFPVKQGLQYKVTFKIQSSVANTVKFRVEATADFTQVLSLKGAYDIEEFSFTTSPMDRDGDNANFMFAFGSPAVPAEIWLDDIVIEEIGGTGVAENVFNDLNISCVNKNLVIDTKQPCSVNLYDVSGKLLSSHPGVGIGKTYINVDGRNQIVIVKAINTNNAVVEKKILVQ